ncbi:MAG: hypothetical protein U9Q15_02010 [Patescibacteria group bacterium]|nr:hypothetical protein [Patescibacteria group bacterium]
MLLDSVLVLPIILFVFVVETLSVIIQLTSKKLRNGKKVFHIAPFHHHLEYLGWSESRIVMRAWIVGVISAGIGVIVGLIGMGI